MRALGVDVLADDETARALVARWRLGDGSTLTLALNLGPRATALPELPVGKIVFETPPRARDALVDARLPARACIAWRDRSRRGRGTAGRLCACAPPTHAP